MEEFEKFTDAFKTRDLQPLEQGIDPDRRIETGDDSKRVFRFDEPAIDPDIRAGGSRMSFRGFKDVAGIADIQFGGTCWAEAIQKAIQLTVGDKKGELNNLSGEIIAKVFLNPEKWDAIENTGSSLAIERYNIPSSRYPDMFREFGIAAENRSFSHDVLKEALGDHRPVLIAGDVKYLDGLYGGEEGNHVLVAVDWNESTQRYTLLDSNFDHVYEVSPRTLEKFAKGDFTHKVADFVTGQMTVVETPSAWSEWPTTWDVDIGEGWSAHFVDGQLAASLDDFQRFTGGGGSRGIAGREAAEEGRATDGISFGRSGDAELNRLLDEAAQLRKDISADFEASGGIQGSIERGLERWKSAREGLENYIRQTLDWLDKASPEEVRKYAGNIEIEKLKTADEAKRIGFIQEMSEWKERQIKHQTQEQFDAEKKGYRQVFPAYLTENWDKDHNIFERDGEYFRLIPNSGGKMEAIPQL